MNEQLELLQKACDEIGAKIAVNENGEMSATLNGEKPRNLLVRVIEDINAPLTARVIKNKDKTFDIIIANIPDFRSIYEKDAIISDFIQKYFSSAYVRKLVSLPNTTKIVDLLTPQNSGGFVANPITKPFNDLCKALAITLKKVFPLKATIINANAVKTFLVDENTANLLLGDTIAKGEKVSASKYINALLKWHTQSDNENAVNIAHKVHFTANDYKAFAVESLSKSQNREIAASVDEAELDF